MKVAIMQPYLFPYIGYFQLINAVDFFVVYDDVQYIRRGWINRNNILINGEEKLFTFSVEKKPINTLINEIYYKDNMFDIEKDKFLNTIRHTYSRAPNFNNIYKLISNCFMFKDKNIARFNENSLRLVCDYLEIKTTFLRSSEIKKDNFLKGQDKIIELVKKLNCETYINPIGGIDLYSKYKFKENGINLYFLKTKLISYNQYSNNFIGNLSIIDVLMFNTKDEVKVMLEQYELI